MKLTPMALAIAQAYGRMRLIPAAAYRVRYMRGESGLIYANLEFI